MKVIVVGAGEVGIHIAERLSKEVHEVTVIEKSRDKERQLRAKLNALVILGSGANAEVLEQAGIAGADLFIAVTDQDEVNLVACLLAHECGTKKIIARIKSLEYTTAEWARNTMANEMNPALLNPSSPHGWWEITQAGREYLESN